MDPVRPAMLNELRDHILERRDHGSVQVFRMHRPGTGIYSVSIIFAENRIIITGDIMLGEKGQGVVSPPGYSLGWFCGQLGWDYLASKFLGNDHWSAERAEEWCREMAKEYRDGNMTDEEEEAKKTADSLEEAAEDLKNGELTEFGLSDALQELGADGDGGIPGYGYDEAEAGWLSAIQQRFAQLYSAMPLVEAKW